MTRLRLIGAALLLISAHPPTGPTKDEVLRCYFITHPNQGPLPLTRWPELTPRYQEKIA